MMTGDPIRRQRGFALAIFLIILVLGVVFATVSQLEIASRPLARGEATLQALAQAKEALIGYAATYRDDPTHSTEVFGYLPCPDTDGDGEAEPYCTTGGVAAIGLLPYKTLGLADLRDSDGVCLWYAVAGAYKNNPKAASAMNWDTQGQFAIAGTTVAPESSDGGGAAVIFAAGPPLAGQSRTPASNRCGVTPSEVAAYLDGGNAFTPGAAVISLTPGTTGSTTNNDRMVAVTPREIFDRVVKRADFGNPAAATPAGQINALANEAKSVIEARMQTDITSNAGVASASLPTNVGGYTQFSGKGIGDAPTGLVTGTYANYYTNWSEQFRLVTCSSIDAPCLQVNSGTANCRGTLAFAGRATTGQPRTSAQKVPGTATLGNFFESALGLLNTAATAFTGNEAYAPATPGGDFVTCLFPGSFGSLARDATAFAAGTVSSSGGGSAVASVTTSGTPTINLGSGTDYARAGSVWYPTALPLGTLPRDTTVPDTTPQVGNLRVYFKFRINTLGPGFTLALADATINDPTSTDPLMAGASSSSRLGYAGAPISGTATGGATRAISAVSYSGGRAYITTATNHGFWDGQTITISGVSPLGYNGTFAIDWVDWDRFSYVVADPGPRVAGIRPPKLALEFDTHCDSTRNDPPSGCSGLPHHYAFDYWGFAADNDPAPGSTTQDGSDDVTHNTGVAGDGSQPLNPRSLSITAATAMPVANVAAARWSGGTATITTTAAHGFTTGQSVEISDVSPLGYKGTRTATVTDASHFTYALASDPGQYPDVATVASASWSSAGSGTAAITTSAAHGLSSGQVVTLGGISPAKWNGTHAVTVTDATHFTFALTTDPGVYASGGTVSAPLRGIAGATWSGSYGGLATIATAVPHGLLTGQFVTISGIAPAGYDGVFRITVTDATHFTFRRTTNPGVYSSGGVIALAPIVQSIAGASWSGGQASFTTRAPHYLATGQTVAISGTTPAGYNGVFSVAVTDATHFTIPLAANPGAYSAGGSVKFGGGGMTSSVMASGVSSANITGATWSRATARATLVTAAAHGLVAGQRVHVAGVSPTGYNGTFTVASATTTAPYQFTYALADDPGGSFAGGVFARPGIATTTMPTATDIHVRLDLRRSYDAATRQATLHMKAYVGNPTDFFCLTADFQNLARDLPEICAPPAATIEQSGVVINDVAGPALENVYLGFTNSRSSSSTTDQSVSITNVMFRSQ
jgi:hypothetical protein